MYICIYKIICCADVTANSVYKFIDNNNNKNNKSQLC